MANGLRPPVSPIKPYVARGLAGLSSALMLSACAETGLLDAKPQTAMNDAAAADDVNATPQTELQKATIYWGQEYAKNPGQLQPALNYARNLKAMGQKQQALAVLQQASNVHSKNAEVASEYGRIALDLDQVSVAQKYLEFADNPAKPDWRVISARGTVLAKQGQYKDAIPFYERALALQPNQPSVLNNLAMAQAASGDAAKAEGLLRQAAAAGGNSPKVDQNLALVLGLQGKYDEAKSAVATALPADAAAANTDYVRRMVKLPAKAAPVAPAAAPVSTAAAAAPATTQLKPTSVDTASASGDLWQTSVASAKAAPAKRPAATLLKGPAS